MRTATLTVDGRDYLLCFSARVMRACSERYGGVENIDAALGAENTGKALDEAVWLLSKMMDAGARYAKINGQEAEALTYDDLYDVLSIDDLTSIKGKIAETITNGRATTVEAEPPKNAGTTPGK